MKGKRRKTNETMHEPKTAEALLALARHWPTHPEIRAKTEQLLQAAEKEAAAITVTGSTANNPVNRDTVANAASGSTVGNNWKGSALGELANCFAGPLSFGTAGLRAPLGPGPARMNRVVVAQASAGFARYLLWRRWRQQERRDAGLRDSVERMWNAGAADAHPSIVIGFDARHGSREFAVEAAEVFSGMGIDVTLIGEPCPTPLLSFAVRHLEVSAGVMVTASHNPPEYNGYKVYLGGEDEGAQIVPPQDADISGHIAEAARLPYESLPRENTYRIAGAGLQESYVRSLREALDSRDGLRAPGMQYLQDAHSCELRVRHVLPGVDSAANVADVTDVADVTASDAPIVYTAMHGVGYGLTRRVFAGLGLPSLTPVLSQCDPDPDFSTVEFPNPEEPGALDLAFALARDVGAWLVLAHDPDADRLAVAAPHPDAPDGFRALSGNELGVLLGWLVARRVAKRVKTVPQDVVQDMPQDVDGADVVSGGERPVLACTIVSSPVLACIAEVYGLGFAETLSGFKWVGRVPGLVFGFEEALGYLCTPCVSHDKDGVSAAVLAVELALELRGRGVSLWRHLDEAATVFGGFASGSVTLRLPGVGEVRALMAGLRRRFASFRAADVMDATEFTAGVTSGVTPGVDVGVDAMDVDLFSVGGVRLRSVTDFLCGGAAVSSDMLRFDFVDGSRIMVRPSGTEPKLKSYIDIFAPTSVHSSARDEIVQSALVQSEDVQGAARHDAVFDANAGREARRAAERRLQCLTVAWRELLASL